jgi:hypothetical protein
MQSQNRRIPKLAQIKKELMKQLNIDFKNISKHRKTK